MDEINYTSEDLCDHHAVAAIIKNYSGDILMQQHVKYGFWTIPLGKAVGDDVIGGIKRELFEECDIEIIDVKELCMRFDVYSRNGKGVKVTGHLFEVLSYRGEIKNKEPLKHIQQIFLSVDVVAALPYLSDMTLLYLNTLGIKRNARI